jgi:hypothetical protein
MAAFHSIGSEPGDLAAGTRHRQEHGAAGLLKFSAPTPSRGMSFCPAAAVAKAGGCRLFGQDHAQIMRKRMSAIIMATYDVVLTKAANGSIKFQ